MAILRVSNFKGLFVKIVKSIAKLRLSNLSKQKLKFAAPFGFQNNKAFASSNKNFRYIQHRKTLFSLHLPCYFENSMSHSLWISSLERKVQIDVIPQIIRDVPVYDVDHHDHDSHCYESVEIIKHVYLLLINTCKTFLWV